MSVLRAEIEALEKQLTVLLNSSSTPFELCKDLEGRIQELRDAERRGDPVPNLRR